eukprot:6672478-Karenia_brevis.AAC.1
MYATGGGVVEPPKWTPGITNNGSNVNNGPSPFGSNGANVTNGNSFEDMLKGSSAFQHPTSNFSGLESKVGAVENTCDELAKTVAKISRDQNT